VSELFARLQGDLNAARKAQDKPATLLLGTVLADVKNRRIELRRELTDDDVGEVLRKGIKRRRESAEMYRKHGEGRLAGATPRVALAAACIYTVTPDRGFIIDRHPDQDRVFVISACSGHGFKHSAGIGNVAAAMVTDGRSAIDLAPFSISRFS